jgi:biopolymer transport protein ExbB
MVFTFGVVGPGVPTARAAAENGDDGMPKKGEEPNLMLHILESAGWVFGSILLLMSIALVTLIVLLAMDLRMSQAIPADFVEDFTDTVNKRQFKQAFDMARNDTSFLARVLTAGMGRLQYGLEDAREAAVNTTDSVRAGKDNLITYLATIGTLGPMFGLVGTVFGMIQSFMVMAQAGATAPPASELAKGISHALVVTLLGIALSVPAIFCHAFFRNRLVRLTMDVNNLADDLLTQMYHNSKRPPVAETTTRTSATAPMAATVVPTAAPVEARAASPAIKSAEPASRPSVATPPGKST